MKYANLASITLILQLIVMLGNKGMQGNAHHSLSSPCHPTHHRQQYLHTTTQLLLFLTF
jgi:hypothetical protein